MKLTKFQFVKNFSIEFANDNGDYFYLKLISMDYLNHIYESISPNTVKYTSFDLPKSVEETRAFVKSAIEKNVSGKDLILMILTPNQDFVGLVGIHHIDKNDPVIGLWIKDIFHNKGIGKSSTKALLAYIKGIYSYNYIIYPVAEKNIPSQKIAKYLGGILDKKYKEYLTKYTLIRYIIPLN